MPQQSLYTVYTLIPDILYGVKMQLFIVGQTERRTINGAGDPVSGEKGNSLRVLAKLIILFKRLCRLRQIILITNNVTVTAHNGNTCTNERNRTVLPHQCLQRIASLLPGDN